MASPQPKAILITGASSGLGAALAAHFAAPGTTLFLSGRHSERLAKVVANCRKSGATVHGDCIDVTDQGAMQRWISRCDRQAPLELVIANAGVSGGTADGPEGNQQTRHIFAINIDGVLNTIFPAIPLMAKRHKGQIALVSSVAGFMGLPNAPAYCASKAAVKTLGEGMRPNLAAQGIKLSVICPGYVKTAMTDANNFPMPFLMPAERAAALIARRLAANHGRIVFPWPMLVLARIMQALPAEWLGRMMMRLPAKAAAPPSP